MIAQDTHVLQYQGKKLEEGSLPALPIVLQEATALMNNNRASVVKVAEVLSKDQSLSAKVLKIINSPVYGFAGRISTIQNAVALLGFSVIYNIIISSVVSETMLKTVRSMWEHSYACSLACGKIAKYLNLENVSEYVVSGLLHDFGKAIVINNFPEAYKAIAAKVNADDIPYIDAEKHVLGFTHLHVNGWIATHWNLPPSLKNAMAYHHTPMAARSHVPVVCVVHLADFFVRLFECGYGGDHNVSKLDFTIMRQINLGKDDLMCLIDDLGELLESHVPTAFS